MKPRILLLASALSVLLAGTLAGCASWARHGAPAQGRPGAGRIGMGRMMGDHGAMCELYRRLAAARTPEERQAMLDRYMAGMSPETRRERLRMMREQCR